MKKTVLLAILMAPILLMAQAANDDCINAEVLTFSMGQSDALIDLTDATDDDLEDCDAPGVWYTFTVNAGAAPGSILEFTLTSIAGRRERRERIRQNAPHFIA